MFSVSLGAILLSLYYVFLWKNPHTMAIDNRVSPDHDDLKGQVHVKVIGCIFIHICRIT